MAWLVISENAAFAGFGVLCGLFQKGHLSKDKLAGGRGRYVYQGRVCSRIARCMWILVANDGLEKAPAHGRIERLWGCLTRSQGSTSSTLLLRRCGSQRRLPPQKGGEDNGEL